MSQRDDDAFSLVEVLIAMFILSMMSLAVLPLLITATAISVDNRDTVQTTALADAHLAAIRAQFPAQPVTETTCAGLHTAVAKLLADDPTVPNVEVPDGFSRSMTVESCPPGAAAGKPAALLVTVRITPAAGHTVALKSRISVSKG